MSGFEYTKSIIFGAATGALASFAPGIVGGVLAGGTGSAAHNFLSQSHTRIVLMFHKLDQLFWQEHLLELPEVQALK
jgi:hypothetical protein